LTVCEIPRRLLEWVVPLERFAERVLDGFEKRTAADFAEAFQLFAGGAGKVQAEFEMSRDGFDFLLRSGLRQHGGDSLLEVALLNLLAFSIHSGALSSSITEATRFA